MSPLYRRFDIRLKDRYRLRPASLRERIFAQLVDGILLGAVCAGMFYLFSGGQVISVWVSPMIPQYLLEIQPGYLPRSSAILWGGLYWSVTLPYGKIIHLGYPSPLLWFMYGLYYTLFTSRFGQTPGKMLKHLVVLDREGRLLSPGRAFLRWLGYLLSLIPLGIGFWEGSRDQHGCGWHDRLAGSRVHTFREPGDSPIR